MPLRTRLILAFVLLIVSSASATILIGNTVFGRKFDEVASDIVALYARQAAHVLDSRLEEMRQAAYKISVQCASGVGLQSCPDFSTAEVPLDFSVVENSPASHVLLPLLERARKNNAAAAGIVAVGGSEIAGLTGGSAEDEDVLLVVAAAPPAKKGGPGVLVGRVLNGRTDLLERVRDLIPDERKDRLLISLFLGVS